MYLEDVNIEGFKSFSEETNMSFQPGIGVIMGNNGVGKSNILDAIVWAMGENDLRRVRCHEPGELFFSGSKAYPPAETARVELNFKTSAAKDATLVRMTREATRSGENRYRIDDTPAEAESYRDKLREFRLADALSTIIRQEEINDILSTHPRQRFETVQALLGIEAAEQLGDCLLEEIDPLFQRYMNYLMPLGKAALLLPSDNGRRALDIEVTLPGNRVRRAHQLSGGEKSITSLALKLALFSRLDSSLFLMDEVEPSLDYTNHKSMQTFLKEVASKRQLVMITHLRSTIELADTLHGVRTRFDGSSFMKFYFVMDQRLLRLYKCC
jgi:chromosome segregation protein